MHLLVVLRPPNYFRHVEGIVREVGRRGGRVTVIADEPASLPQEPDLAASAWLQVLPMLPNASWLWQRVQRHNRRMSCYLHWLAQDVQPEASIRFLRSKVTGKWQALVRRLHWMRAERVLVAIGLRHVLGWLERAIPPSQAVVRQIREVAPDVTLVTPAIFGLSPEADYQKASQMLGIPTAVFIASWDNLTMKGTFHVPPEWVIVWNDIQVREAERYHHLPTNKVLPVGAPLFDDAFETGWLIDREEFCRRAGLDPGRPYFVYAVSSKRMCGDETDIVANLAHELRRQGNGNGVQLLVRPHPVNQRGWDEFTAEGVSVWTTPGFPSTPAAKSDLYNSLYHAAGVIGLNTSMFLEAAILDRPGITFYSQEQEATIAGEAAAERHAQFLHFRYLLEGGFLETVTDAEACGRTMLALLEGRDEKRIMRREFVRRFLRPTGWGMPARRVAADTLESIAGGAISRRPTAPGEQSPEQLASETGRVG